MGCIIFETYGTDGDVLPFVRIGRQLVKYGHKVALVTHSYYEEIAKEANIDFISVDTPAEYAQFINDNAAISQNPQGHITFIKRHVLSHILSTYEKIKEYYIPNQTVILGKVPAFLSALVAERLNIPRIAVYLSPSFVMTEEFIVLFYNFLKEDICDLRDKMGLPHEYNWELWWKSAKSYIGLWPSWFELDTSHSNVNIEKIGFVVDTSETGYLPDEVISLLNEEDKPVLINTSSSSLFINSNFFESSIKACELLGQKAILVGRHKEFLPSHLPKEIHVFDHLQFDILMPRVKAIIHHGGIGTSAQALASSLPQLVLAGGVDRPDNAMCLKKLGVAEYLLPPQWNSNSVLKALKKVTNSQCMKESCLKIRERMIKENPIDTLRNKIESFLNDCLENQKKDKPCCKEKGSNITLEKVVQEKKVVKSVDIDNELDKYIKVLSQEQLELLLLFTTRSNQKSPKIENIIMRQPRKEGINIFPLTFMQEEFYFLQKAQPECLGSNLYSAYVINGSLNVCALEKTFHEIIMRHENLHTYFDEIDGKPMQFILPTVDFELPIINIQGIDKEKQYNEVLRILAEKTYEPFDFKSGPLIRFLLIKISEDEHVVWWGVHHILIDGWGLSILINEIKELYSWFAFNKRPNLPEIKIQCADFAIWQGTYLDKKVMDEKVQYWINKLSGYNSKLSLAGNCVRSEIKINNGSEEHFYISKDIETKLKDLSCEMGNSLFMTLLAAYNLLIYSFTGQLDIVLGSPISARNQEELEHLICDFTNLLAYRTIFDEYDSIYDVLGKVKKTALGAYKNQEVPSQKLANFIEKEVEPGYCPLFQMLFIFHEIFPAENEQFLEGLTTRYLNIGKNEVQFDISLFMFDNNQDGLYGKFEYNNNLFSSETISNFINHFSAILELIVEDQNLKICEIKNKLLLKKM